MGFIPKEDRLVLMLALKNGNSVNALFSRRMLQAMLKSMGEKLASTSPTASRTPDPHEVLQMEHIAAVTSRKPEATGSVTAGETDWYITEVQMETRDNFLVLGLKGELRNPTGPDGTTAEPVAALQLERSQAHQILRMLKGQADQAGWGLELPADWMRPMEYGRGGD